MSSTFDALRAPLMAELAGHRIAEVMLEFDGYCDDGHFHDIRARDAAGKPCDLAWQTDISPNWIGGVPIRDLLEDLAYDLLCEVHPGWEIDEGSHGTITIAPEALVRVELESRYIETRSFTYER